VTIRINLGLFRFRSDDVDAGDAAQVVPVVLLLDEVDTVDEASEITLEESDVEMLLTLTTTTSSLFRNMFNVFTNFLKVFFLFL